MRVRMYAYARACVHTYPYIRANTCTLFSFLNISNECYHTPMWFVLYSIFFCFLVDLMQVYYFIKSIHFYNFSNLHNYTQFRKKSFTYIHIHINIKKTALNNNKIHNNEFTNG